MPDNPAKEAINDMLNHVESLETQTGAILRFMRDNGMLTDETFAPYMEQAAVASEVKARAARARIEHLFASDDKGKPAAAAVPAPAGGQESQGAPHQPASLDKQNVAESSRTESSEKTQRDATQGPKQPSEIVSGNEALKGSKDNSDGQRSAPNDARNREAA